jgi:hypothetical protein
MDMHVPAQTRWRGFSEPSRRWPLLLVLIVLGLAQTGCGSETESQEPRQGLSNTQFRELERLYVVQVEAEKLEDKGRDGQALRKTAKACAAVDDSDPLLAVAVNGCREIVRLTLSMDTSKCDTRSDCVQQLRSTATKTDDIVDTLRQNERTLDGLLGEGDCREALATPREFLAIFDTLSRALREMATGIESGDDALLNDAARSLDQAEKDLEDAPSAAVILERFREECA